jgi:hypothetical protein
MSTIAATNLKNASSGSNNIVLNSDGTTTIASPSNIIKSGTSVASTSGTSIDFTSIPSWVKRVTVMLNGVSTNGAAHYLVQIGTSSGIDSTGYDSCSVGTNNTGGGTISSTAGFILRVGSAATSNSGHVLLTTLGSNVWVESQDFYSGASGVCTFGGGTKTLSGTLDRVRITTVTGTDTFDAGSINILYEG